MAAICSRCGGTLSHRHTSADRALEFCTYFCARSSHELHGHGVVDDQGRVVVDARLSSADIQAEEARLAQGCR